MDINSIITLVAYVILSLTLLIGFFVGLKRGLKKSAIHFGTLAVFILIAGFITAPISLQLTKINISSFNLKIGETVVETIPHAIQILVESAPGFESVLDAVPSITSLIEQLPVAVLNIIVFFFLVSVMKVLSLIVSAIISRFALRETRLERAAKKQKKLERKLDKGLNPKTQAVIKQQALPLPFPKKHRLWGGIVGSIQGLVLLFLFVLPFTSLLGIVNEISHAPENTLVVYADNSEESLSEFSYDLLTSAVGEDILSYVETFNNSTPVKIASFAGLNNLIFDSLINIKINDQNISLRKEAITAIKIYDNYVLALDEFGQEENLSDFNFEIIEAIFKLVFNSDLVHAFGEEGAMYASSQLDNLDSGSFLYFEEIQDSVDQIIKIYKNEPRGFIFGLKNDIEHLLVIAKNALTSGLVDDAITQSMSLDDILNDIKKSNYKLLSTFVSEGYSTSIIKVATTTALNVLLDLGSSSLSDENYTANLGSVVYKEVDWNSSKSSIYNLVKNLLDVYDTLNLYDISVSITNLKDLIHDFADEDVYTLFSLVGKEIDFVKSSPLFNEQVNPVSGLINWLENNNYTEELIDAPAMLEVSSWQETFEPFSSSFFGLRDSGILDLILEGNPYIDDIIDALNSPSSSEPGAESYTKLILRPIIDSSISKGLIVYALNEINTLLQENLSMGLIMFSKESFPTDQNEDILIVIDNVLQYFTILDDGELDLETVDVSKPAALLTALQNNAYRKNTSAPIEYNVDLNNKTIAGGGIFSNLYVSLVVYIFGDETSINLKTVNWNSLLQSTQDLFSTLENLGDDSSFDNLLDLGSEESQDFLENLLESLDLDPSIAQDLVDINEAIEVLSGNSPEMTDEEAYENIDQALNNLLESQDEEGNNTIESLIEIVESITGENISNEVNLTIIEKEQIVNTRLALLNSLTPPYQINAGDETPDNIHPDLNLLGATIKDLTCGGTFVLTNFRGSGKLIMVSSEYEEIRELINSATDNVSIQELVISVFGFAK